MNRPKDTRPCIVMLWYELTPYQVHALARMQRELPEVRWVHVFTHSISTSSMPWDLQVPDGIELLFDERNKIPNQAVIHWRFAGMFRFLRSVIRKHQPLLVVTAGHEDISRWLLIPYLRARRIPFVLWSDSNVYGLNRGRPIKDTIRRAYLRAMIRGFDAYMPMGHCGRAYYAMLGGRHKPMFTRPYEPDYELIRKRNPREELALAERLGLDPTRKRFLYSGRLISVKRVDLLLEAFSRVAPRIPEWDLLIVGGGPLEAELRRSVPQYLNERIRFTGFLQMHEVRMCYHLSSALVHPSEFEPWALVINEAVAAGLPVVATYVTGAAVELVTHNVNGILVAPGSVQELEQALMSVSDLGRLARFRDASTSALARWQMSGDPVAGLRECIRHFACIHRPNRR